MNEIYISIIITLVEARHFRNRFYFFMQIMNSYSKSNRRKPLIQQFEILTIFIFHRFGLANVKYIIHLSARSKDILNSRSVSILCTWGSGSRHPKMFSKCKCSFSLWGRRLQMETFVQAMKSHIYRLFLIHRHFIKFVFLLH